VIARTVQEMARARFGQAPAWPLVSGRRGAETSLTGETGGDDSFRAATGLHAPLPEGVLPGRLWDCVDAPPMTFRAREKRSSSGADLAGWEAAMITSKAIRGHPVLLCLAVVALGLITAGFWWQPGMRHRQQAIADAVDKAARASLRKTKTPKTGQTASGTKVARRRDQAS
jgi:hypothetical protein